MSASPQSGEVEDDLLLNQGVNGWRSLGSDDPDRFFGAHPLVDEGAGQHGACPALARIAMDDNGAVGIGGIQEGQELLDLLDGWRAKIWNGEMKIAQAEAPQDSFI